MLGEVISELKEYLESINLTRYEGRGRLEGAQILSDAITKFYNTKGFQCTSRVILSYAIHGRDCYLKHVVHTPNHRYAIEVGSCNRKSTLLKLEYAHKEGFIPILVRWNVRQRLPVPDGIHVIDLTRSW